MHEYMSTERIWELTCPGLPEEVGRVRRWTRDVLRDSSCGEDATLIVSELGSNALVHSASGGPNGSFHISLHRSPGTVVLAVTDTGGGETEPHVETPDEDDTHGRGLGLVAALANRVQVSGDDYGRTVTVEINDQHQAPAKPSTRRARVALPAPRSMT
ncbi:ATP-binding protein [Streptomyces albus]|uniref:ATP-binding protein n=1 Tax=Streptomyces sp. NRRL F-5917 TaxID=1463873 RepID=UPI0004BE65E3|nr:ATP-binding protein [Streptomyces sp. NRRL F-5917]